MNTENLVALLGRIPRAYYCGARYAFLACSGDGHLHNLVCSILFDVAPPKPDWSCADHYEDIRVCRGWLSTEQAQAAIVGIAEGSATLGSQTVAFLCSEPGKDFARTTQPEKYRWQADANRVESGAFLRWPYLCGRGTGDYLGNLLGHGVLDRLDNKLHFLERPFRTWDDLTRFLHAPAQGRRENALAFCLLPIYVALSDAEHDVEGQSVVAHIRRRGELPPDAALVAFQEPLPPNRLPASSWRTTERGSEARVEGLRRRGPVHVRLTAFGLPLDEHVVDVPAVALNVHKVFDPTLDWLHEKLRGDGKKSNAKQRDAMGFERGVMVLLGLGGLSVVGYGHRVELEGPDFLAWVDDTLMLVGECTVAVPDTDKLEELHERGLLVRQKVAGMMERPPEVAEMLFTPASYEVVPGALRQSAEQMGIGIITAAELAALEMRIGRGDSPRRLGAFFRRCLSPHRILLDEADDAP